MKPSVVYACGVALVTSLAVVACDVDDDPLTVIPNDPPLITIADAAGMALATSGTDGGAAVIELVAPQTEVEVVVTFTDPDGNLAAFTIDAGDDQIREDGQFIAERVDLAVPDASSFTRTYELIAPSEAEATRTFSFTAVDDGTTAAQFIETSTASVTLRLLTDLTDVTDGPVAFAIADSMSAGIDLDGDQVVGVADADAELVARFGEDGAFAPGLRAGPGASLRVDTSATDYDGFSFQQNLVDAFDQGVAAPGNAIDSLFEGQVFFVNVGGDLPRYYAVRVADVDASGSAAPGLSLDYSTAVIGDE